MVIKAPAAIVVALSLGVLLLTPSAASAGGAGLFNGTGLHVGKALNSEGGQGTWLNEGGGIELFLGDIGGRLHGRVRFAYNAVIDLYSDASLREAPRSTGLIAIGANVHLLPNLEQVFGLYALADAGVAPIVRYQRTYFFFDVGAGVRALIQTRVELFAELTAIVRYEGGFSAGPMVYFGARLAFD